MPNFKKTRGFTLKSGNNPSMSSFKMMGSTKPSPITSPYKQAVDANTNAGTDNENEEVNKKKEVEVNKSDADNITENIVEQPKVNKTKTIASKIGNTLVGAFTSGLDAVYGSGKVIPGNKVKFHDPKKKKEEKEFGTTALDNDEK